MIYDPFQQQAIDFIRYGHSVIVSAPTGAGKTAIAEYVITDCLSKNKNAVYTAPVKALSNQKYRDFKEIYGDKIGILTGDVTINPTAPILIMTTEIFRNKLLEKDGDLESYSWIIFDEIHYLDDHERGTVWEESLIFLPEHMKMLALSATIPNTDEFARWIQSIHKKPIKIVTEDSRPVPLHFFYQCQGEIVDNLAKVRKTGYSKNDLYRHYRGRMSGGYHHLKPNRPVALVKHLEQNERLPCIYFSFGRRRCEHLALEMARFDFLTDDERANIKAIYKSLCEKFDITGEKSASSLLSLVERGIAYHHAGMFPTLKEVVERLFTSRLIKVIFTTETFALGINMPARTVVFDELRKYHGTHFGSLKTRDFYQMAGRAGRRGIDLEGFVYSRVNPRYTTFDDLNRIIHGRREEVRSRFNTSYATTLNLYEKFGEKLYDIYPYSFHYFQEKEKNREKALELLRSKVKILKDLRYIEGGLLTEKGNFASKIHGYELSLAELYEKGMLEELSEIEIGILCLALVFEPRKGSERPRLSKKIRNLCEKTNSIVGGLEAREKKLRISPLSKNYYYFLAPCLEAWMNNEAFDDIMRHTDADAGEIIRYFRMAIQIMREIIDTPASQSLKYKVNNAIRLINRDVIDAEKQLRG
ncbi:MAG: DEAD/DEAH box helicase [Candidatus Omnitrophica bacterium]|nr:DEAD/DEAH box helicase [Candidatus Omnitrophota bacterium]